MLGALALLSLLSASSFQSEPVPNLVVASGQSDITVPADAATVSVNVAVRDETEVAALDATQKQTDRLLASLRRVLPDKDAYRIGKPYTLTYPQMGGGYPGSPTQAAIRNVPSYQTTQSIGVAVDLPRLPALLKAATEASDGSRASVNYTVKEPAALRRRALREAFEDARRKATELAEAAGKRLGDVYLIESGNAPVVSGSGFGASFSQVHAVDLTRGTVSATAAMTVRFRLVG